MEEAFDRAEASLDAGSGLGGTGFWAAVNSLKSDPGAAAQFADRVGEIDRKAFLRWALLTVPIVPGTIVMTLMAVVGVLLVGLAYPLDGWWAIFSFFAGFAAVLVATHGLAHLLVGRALGIEFTHWFIGDLARPQPGVKTDYASYMLAAPRSRAWMHASGAIVTKLIPFAFVGAAIAAGLPSWCAWLLVVVGIGQIATDVLWSTRASDWKKFRREMNFAHDS